MKIKQTSCIQFFIYVLLLLNVPFIKHTLGSKMSMMLLLAVEAVIIVMLIFAYIRHHFITRPLLILLSFGVYLLLTTVIHAGGLGNYLALFFPVILICAYFHLVQMTGGRLEDVLKGWIVFFAILVLVDIITIVLFPKGLYYGNAEYHAALQRNWFLGYKTNRLAYSFPLLVFYSYYLQRKKTFRFRSLLLYLIIFFDMFLTDGAAGTFILAVYLIISIVYIVSLQRKKTIARGIVMLLNRYYWFLAFFVFVTIAVVLVQSNRSLIRAFGALFGKSDTLSNRTPIWEKSLLDIKNHFFLGHGIMDGAGFAKITGGYVNPHNIVLSYLLTGGIIGLVIFVIYFLYCVRRVNQAEENYLFLLAVYCILILGVTSSTLSFSPFLFLFILLIHDRSQDKRKAVHQRGITQ